MNVIIPANVLNAIHDYLLTRPMREVEGLVSAIRQTQPVEVENTASDRRASHKAK